MILDSDGFPDIQGPQSNISRQSTIQLQNMKELNLKKVVPPTFAQFNF